MELSAVKRDVEEEDESGAPDRVAWPERDEGHPLESADELHEPPYERSEDVTARLDAVVARLTPEDLAPSEGPGLEVLRRERW